MKELIKDIQAWQEWIKNKSFDHRFGRMVGTAIREEVNLLKNENHRLKNELSKYVDIEGGKPCI